MLLLSIILLSGCLSDSLGNAIGEFQVNFEAVVEVAHKEFLLVPCGRFQCDQVPCQLGRTVEQLKLDFKDHPSRNRVSLMETNMKRIVSALNETRTMLKNSSSCPMSEIPPQEALKCYRKFFQKLEEKC